MPCLKTWTMVPSRYTRQGQSLTDKSSGATQGNQQDALIATVIVGLCNHFSTYISFWLADQFGRRFLFIECATACALKQCSRLDVSHNLHLQLLAASLRILAIRRCMARGRLLPGCKAVAVCIPHAWVFDSPVMSTAGAGSHFCGCDYAAARLGMPM